MKKEFSEKLKELANQIDVNITDEQIEKFYIFMNLLLEWNEKINLTAITEEDDIILKHFIDSLTVLKYIKDGENIIDVGTGAGFPGIPVAIIKEEVNVTLLDSLNKRINFLNDVCDKTSLNNIISVHGRAEDFGQNKEKREKYDIAVSRAVANLTTLVEYLLPLVKIGGKCICMKGLNIEKEVQDAKFAIKELGGKIERVENFILPNSDIERNIIIIKKIKETPKKFPRKSGLPNKQPLIAKNNVSQD